MPTGLLSGEIEALPGDMEAEDAVRALADRFQVSEQAMTLRLTRLGVLA